MMRTKAPVSSSGQAASSEGPGSSATATLPETADRVVVPPATAPKVIKQGAEGQLRTNSLTEWPLQPGMGVEAAGQDGGEEGETAPGKVDTEKDGVAKETVRMQGLTAERDPDSPLRILVRCLSHKIPGPRSERTGTMANIICQHQFQRNMDSGKDTINVMGLQDIDGKKVRFLLQSGNLPTTTALDDVPILAFKWTGEKL